MTCVLFPFCYINHKLLNKLHYYSIFFLGGGSISFSIFYTRCCPHIGKGATVCCPRSYGVATYDRVQFLRRCETFFSGVWFVLLHCLCSSASAYCWEDPSPDKSEVFGLGCLPHTVMQVGRTFLWYIRRVCPFRRHRVPLSAQRSETETKRVSKLFHVVVRTVLRVQNSRTGRPNVIQRM